MLGIQTIRAGSAPNLSCTPTQIRAGGRAGILPRVQLSMVMVVKKVYRDTHCPLFQKCLVLTRSLALAVFFALLGDNVGSTKSVFHVCVCVCVAGASYFMNLYLNYHFSCSKTAFSHSETVSSFHISMQIKTRPWNIPLLRPWPLFLPF